MKKRFHLSRHRINFLFPSVVLQCCLLASSSSALSAPSPTDAEVLIIGAGAAGLAAATKLQEQGINFQILEATDRYGGRTQKLEGFADFPIDLGAEWIHQGKDILTTLIEESGEYTNQELIAYRPMDVYHWSDDRLNRYSPWGLSIYYWFVDEYKFKRSTWFDYIATHFASKVQQHIIYNSAVSTIDYSGKRVAISTVDQRVFLADRVILTVPIGVLQSGDIDFIPALPKEKARAIHAAEFLPGFKLFIKFSEKFYPDVVEFDTEKGEKAFYDIAYKKDAEANVLGLLSMGSSANAYYRLGSERAILDEAIRELDILFEGRASQTFTGDYVLKDWGRHQYTKGSWVNDFKHEGLLDALLEPLDNKVYFAGSSFEANGNESTVPGAVLSGYTAVSEVLENFTATTSQPQPGSDPSP